MGAAEGHPMSERLLAAFPLLRSTPFRVTSPLDPTYNCIAWAAGSVADWWWPLDDVEKTYWPDPAPRTHTLAAFRSAFISVGYSDCSDDSLQPGFEKVAVFADAAGRPTHAARQLPTGRWTSKLGQAEDIEHDLRALEGELYGTVVLLMMRPSSLAGSA
jgi:hypothetical protein